jgi:hypothetical protein
MNFIYQEWVGDPKWVGATLSEMNEWLTSGYTVEGLNGVDPSLFPARPKRKIIYAEEGDELLIDLAWSGVDEHFIEWEKRNTKPGLRVEIECGFSATIDSAVLNAYQRWIARMLQSLEEAAIDCEIDIAYRGRNCFSGDYGEVAETRVRVKESGEASDFAAWSAMFSPGGFRQLTFAGIVMNAEFHGKTADLGLGVPVTEREWTLAYDPESNTLRVANSNAGNFPEFEMTEKFKAVLDTLSGG